MTDEQVITLLKKVWSGIAFVFWVLMSTALWYAVQDAAVSLTFAPGSSMQTIVTIVSIGLVGVWIVSLINGGRR